MLVAESRWNSRFKLNKAIFLGKTITKEETKKKYDQHMVIEYKNKKRFLWFHMKPLIKDSATIMLQYLADWEYFSALQ